MYLNTNLHINMTVLFLLIAVLKKILPRMILRFLRRWRNHLSPCVVLVILLAVSKIQYKKNCRYRHHHKYITIYISFLVWKCIWTEMLFVQLFEQNCNCWRNCWSHINEWKRKTTYLCVFFAAWSASAEMAGTRWSTSCSTLGSRLECLLEASIRSTCLCCVEL